MPIHRLVALLLLLFLQPLAAAEKALTAEDIQVEDGDTLIVSLDDRPLRVQLLGIDAPEDQDNPKFRVDLKRTGLDSETLLHLGQVASEQLRFLIHNNGPFRLYFDPERRDRYGRIPGDLVDASGESLAALMLDNGYAIALGSGLDEAMYRRLRLVQLQAFKEGRGLWGLYPDASHRWAGMN